MDFPSTHWSLLARAAAGDDAPARRALEELCQRYWAPVNRFVRFRGFRDAEAEDLTQEFFLHVCQRCAFSRADRTRGRFRSFLLGALVKFLANHTDRVQGIKRGGASVHVSLDELDDDAGWATPPDVAARFDREWAATILVRVMDRVRSEHHGAGKDQMFQVLKRFLPGAGAPPAYDEAARQLGMSVPAFKSEIHRLRLRLRALIRDEVIATVTAPHEVESEIAHLLSVLMDRSQSLDGA